MTNLTATTGSLTDAIANEAIDLDAIGPATLPDGTELDARQNVAATLSALTDLTNAEIAKLAQYSERQAVSRFLNSELGMRAVRAKLISHTVRAGKIGLRETIRLAQYAKSENVRQQAAAKLIDVARLEAEVEAGPSNTGAGAREVSISINLTGPSEPKDVTIEGKAE